MRVSDVYTEVELPDVDEDDDGPPMIGVGMYIHEVDGTHKTANVQVPADRDTPQVMAEVLLYTLIAIGQLRGGMKLVAELDRQKGTRQ